MPNMKVGAMAFLVGIIAALVIGAGDAFSLYVLEGGLLTTMTWILVGAGLVIGFMNIESAESLPFVVAVVALAILSGVFSLPSGNEIVQSLLAPVTTLLVPAALVVVVKMIYEKSRS